LNLSGIETCNTAGVCLFGKTRTCSDGLSCTDDVCDESTKSCANPPTNCLASNDPCATDQCIELLGGCQFTCGATLDTWTDILGDSVDHLVNGTNNLTTTPNKSERLGSLLEAQSFVADYYGSRMKGWLVPPVSGEYVFWIAADDKGEFWLSIDDDPANKVRICYNPRYAYKRAFTWYPEQQSKPKWLVAGQAYYFEVRAFNTSRECFTIQY
jgi:hypothetical protein